MVSNYIYMKVSNDKYELPEIIADSPSELSELCGVSASTIKTSIYRAEKYGVFSCYVRVPLEDLEE